jgi:hypothetical protein
MFQKIIKNSLNLRPTRIIGTSTVFGKTLRIPIGYCLLSFLDSKMILYIEKLLNVNDFIDFLLSYNFAIVSLLLSCKYNMLMLNV